MGLIGYVIDRWAGTGRLFTIGLAVIGVAGIFTKLWLGYDREMKAEEAKLPGHRPATAGLVEAPEQAPDEVEP